MIRTWTFRTFGRFDTRTFRYLSGSFTTPHMCEKRYCKNFFVVPWRNVQVVNWQSSETSCYRHFPVRMYRVYAADENTSASRFVTSLTSPATLKLLVSCCTAI